ncbi:YigZ family protein [Rodentibacter trehalosifermentans]|uniref:YigZ family protein n=1 Tax=Rodentibacter trehalosifermentans TaxID=1908263 RepID=UPI0009854340|nr:YigZ family protein [Rodentibacter trehalosifermentans]OOF51620.1 YigZ family protein [Rodentibacter trehalosifermentans]
MAEYPIPKSAVVFEEEIKKSRFITYLQHTEGLSEARAFWMKIKQTHPQARHHCWATVAGNPADSLQFGFSDDGEPAGTAGKPMLNALQGSGVGELSAVVVRYFGGVLLGTGGLVRAYSSGVQQALKLLETEIKVERVSFRLDCDYGQWGWVQLLCEKYQIAILSQDFQVKIHLILGISEKMVEPFSAELIEKSAGKLMIQPLDTGE